MVYPYRSLPPHPLFFPNRPHTTVWYPESGKRSVRNRFFRLLFWYGALWTTRAAVLGYDSNVGDFYFVSYGALIRLRMVTVLDSTNVTETCFRPAFSYQVCQALLKIEFMLFGFCSELMQRPSPLLPPPPARRQILRTNNVPSLLCSTTSLSRWRTILLTPFVRGDALAKRCWTRVLTWTNR